MYEILDGPSKQLNISVTTTTPVEVKVGTSPLDNRKGVVIQPMDKKIYLYFGDGSGAPTVSAIQNNGIELSKRGIYFFEATNQQDIWILSKTGTASVVIVERG